MCIEIGHSKADCKVVDLYNIDDPVQIQQIMNSIGGQQISNLSGIDHAGSYLNHNHQIEDLNDGDRLLDDDDDDDEFDFD